MLKKCYTCLKDKLIEEFTIDLAKKDGRSYQCIDCNIHYRTQNKNRILKQKAEYRSKNRLALRKKGKIYHQTHKTERANYQKIYRKQNNGKVNSWTANRYAAKIKATPKLLTQEHFNQIEEYYIEAARLSKLHNIEYNVDHIIPLQNKFVCGLHVPWNLQVLLKSANCSKSNKFSL